MLMAGNEMRHRGDPSSSSGVREIEHEHEPMPPWHWGTADVGLCQFHEARQVRRDGEDMRLEPRAPA